MLQLLKSIPWPDERLRSYRKAGTVTWYASIAGFMLMTIPVLLPESPRSIFFAAIGISIYSWWMITMSLFLALFAALGLFNIVVFGFHGDHIERKRVMTFAPLSLVSLVVLAIFLFGINEWVSQAMRK